MPAEPLRVLGPKSDEFFGPGPDGPWTHKGCYYLFLPIPILNESIIETNAKTFLVVLTNATGGATLPGGLPTSFASTQVTIEDNDFTLSHLGFNSTNFLVRLSVNTEPNSRYTFETSTNLLNWKTNWIFTAVDFTTIFNYPETSHPPMKFYRVRYLSGP